MSSDSTTPVAFQDTPCPEIGHHPFGGCPEMLQPPTPIYRGFIVTKLRYLSKSTVFLSALGSLGKPTEQEVSTGLKFEGGPPPHYETTSSNVSGYVLYRIGYVRGLVDLIAFFHCFYVVHVKS